MFKNMKLKKKLILAFIIVAVLASVSGIASSLIMLNANEEYTDAIKYYGFAQGDVGKLLACFGSINVSAHDVVGYVDPAAQEKAGVQYKNQVAKMEDYFKNVEVTIQHSSTLDEFTKAKEAWQKYEPLATEIMQMGYDADEATIRSLQSRLINELDPLYDTIYNSLAQVMFDKVDSGNEVQARLSRSVNLSALMVFGMCILVLLLSVVFGTKLSNSIAKPIQKCAKRLRDLSEGDLKTPVPNYNGEDEIGVLAQATAGIVGGLNAIIDDEKYLLGEMARGNFDLHTKIEDRYVGDFMEVLLSMRLINRHLSETLSQINQSSEQVSSGSDQVSSAAQNLSQGAAEQASSVEDLVLAIGEISKQVQSNAENAGYASEKARQVGDEMEKSNEKMRQMTKAMGEISSSSQEIGKIIKTIEDIAFQTNILALNAAVEAARAGAAGKGFAVVADEVRNLASKSAEASKNTAQLIESSVRAVAHGTQITDETAKALLEAVGGARDVVEIVTKISAASAEQSKSVAQVNRNMDQISSVVQTNSATAEESAAASEELSGQAQMLKQLVGRFKLRKSDYAMEPAPLPSENQASLPVFGSASEY